MTVRVPARLCRRDPEWLARAAGLEFLTDDHPGHGRRRCGRGFLYFDADRNRIGPPERDRLTALAVPPAWSDVWYCPSADGYLQARGRDDADRKQYRYHERFREFRDGQKYERLRYFGRALRPFRRQIAGWLDGEPGTRTYAVAGVLRLLDVGLIRVGNRDSAARGAYGATTLHSDHIEDVEEGYVVLRYRAKGGKERTVEIEDDLMADVLAELADPDAEHLFWYDDDQTGERRRVTAHDVNRTIVEVVGPAFTAKDFRTWGGSRQALEARIEGANEIEAVDAAAEALGNTRTVARAAYVHPAVLEASDDRIADAWRRSRTSTWFSRSDSALAKLLDHQA